MTMNMETLAGKYLTFRLRNETYGIEILKVREIIGMMKVTPMPRTPDFVRGVINLRGRVIPVIDLRLKFGMPSQDDTELSCIIVVQIHTEQKEMVTGLIVDEVSEVSDIDAAQIEDAPTFGSAVDTEFILGIGKMQDRVVLLLDVNRILTGEEVAVLSKTA